MNDKSVDVKGFFLYFDQFEAIKLLNEAQKAMLLDAMFVKFSGGDYEITDPTVKMAFSFISLSHEQRMQKYAEKSEKARENVNKRWENERKKRIPNDTEDTNEYERINRNTDDTITITRTITKPKEDKNISCSLSEKVSDGGETTPVQDSLLSDTDNVKVKKPDVPNCPQDKIIELYHECLPELPQIRSWIGANSTNLRTRWRERWAAGKYKTTEEGLTYWRNVFAWVHDNCPHLMGQNDHGWKMNLAWFVKAANFSKFLNRTYDRQVREVA